MKRDVPHIVLRLLAFWYTNQCLKVQWHDAVSENFKTSNGVKQGGILSPLFFNLYMGELSRNLSNANVGCCVNNTVINHIMYADDLCLLASSAKGLQCLVNIICSKYASDHDIVYNVKTALVHSLCYLNRPNTSKTHRSDDLFINAAVMQLN